MKDKITNRNSLEIFHVADKTIYNNVKEKINCEAFTKIVKPAKWISANLDRKENIIHKN